MIEFRDILSVACNRKSITSFLERNNIDPQAKNYNNSSFLDIVKNDNCDERILNIVKTYNLFYQIENKNDLLALQSVKDDAYPVYSRHTSFDAYTALHEAAYHNLPNTVKALAKKYNNLLYAEDMGDNSALFYAARSGHKEIVKILLDAYNEKSNNIIFGTNSHAEEWSNICKVALKEANDKEIIELIKHANNHKENYNLPLNHANGLHNALEEEKKENEHHSQRDFFNNNNQVNQIDDDANQIKENGRIVDNSDHQ